MTSTESSPIRRERASFRDPSGFLYRREGVLLRQVQASYAKDYEALVSTGLYDELTAAGLLVDHEERPLEESADSSAWRVIRPREIDVISYPYEWSFGQLKDAALLTLDIAERSLAKGLVLKDSTAFNVTFDAGRPIWLDSLSFERHENGEPWQAYSQFCRHFLAPLALAANVDPRLTDLLRVHIEGVPLNLASRLLPRRTWVRPSLLLHLHLHARSQARFTSVEPDSVLSRRSFSRRAFEGLLAGLRAAVGGLHWEPAGFWSGYETDNSYSESAQRCKASAVGRWLSRMGASSVLDLGANTGQYSEIASNLGHRVVALDADPGATELLYRRSRAGGRTSVLPLRVDLLNPSPEQGWGCGERKSLFQRVQPDVVMALALVHHLALTGHIALQDLAEFLSRLAPTLIIEWVPLDDPQARRLVGARASLFAQRYTDEHFRRALGEHFSIVDSVEIPDTKRSLLLLKRHDRSDRLSTS